MGFACVYIDDIVVFSHSAEEHKRNVERMLEVLSLEQQRGDEHKAVASFFAHPPLPSVDVHLINLRRNHEVNTSVGQNPPSTTVLEYDTRP
eukprot:SAG11_NODE_237_length_11835_cov_11.023347_8_plen_91_part_00